MIRHRRGIVLYFVFLAASPGLAAEPSSPPTCRLTIDVVDAATQKAVPSLVRVLSGNGQVVSLDGVLNRGAQLGSKAAKMWYCLPVATAVIVPRDKLTVEAFSGLETETAVATVDVSDRAEATMRLELNRFYDAHARGLIGGNTHLHLRAMPRSASDRYLKTIPRCDGLDLVFVSYLERAKDDQSYITNQYRKHELESLRVPGVRFGYGEEHRHNFGPFDEGYGHVMLLNIQKLIQPVSIGPGIMGGEGSDGIPLQRGIKEARKQGAAVIWCHNDWGREDLPNWIAGTLDAQNIFDGGSHGSYEQSFYRFLNVGWKVPFSTGTDWFMYDFSRVYVPAKDNNVSTWLQSLSEGRTFITNGPFLELSVQGKGPGDVIELDGPGTLAVSAKGVGRHDFDRIDLVFNGETVHSTKAAKKGGHFEATMKHQLAVKEPGWVALRIPGPRQTETGQPLEGTAGRGVNELGRELYAHTSAVTINVGGKSVFKPAVAYQLMREMEQAMTAVPRLGKFTDDAELQAVMTVYQQAVERFRESLESTNEE